MPGSVSGGTEKAQAGEREGDIDQKRNVRDQSPAAIEQDHESHDEGQSGEAGHGAGMDRVGAEVGADGSLLDGIECDRQRTSAQERG
jgi:hypothetical protein